MCIIPILQKQKVCHICLSSLIIIYIKIEFGSCCTLKCVYKSKFEIQTEDDIGHSTDPCHIPGLPLSFSHVYCLSRNWGQRILWPHRGYFGDVYYVPRRVWRFLWLIWWDKTSHPGYSNKMLLEWPPFSCFTVISLLAHIPPHHNCCLIQHVVC